MSKHCCWLAAFVLLITLRVAATPAPPADVLPDMIAHYEADMEDLSKVYIFPNSPEYYSRMRRLHKDALASLQALTFDGLSTSDKVDYVLWQRTLKHSLLEIDQAEKVYDSAAFALPYAQNLMDIQIRRRRGQKPDVQLIARTLDSVNLEIRLARQRLDKHASLSRAQVKMIVDVTESIRKGLTDVETFYEGYDPAYTWWVKAPYHLADSALAAYGGYVAGMVKAMLCATGMKDTRRACREMAWLRVSPLARAVRTKSALTLSSRYCLWAIW